MIEWRSDRFWDRFWQIVALIICIVVVGLEVTEWSTYVPRRMREVG